MVSATDFAEEWFSTRDVSGEEITFALYDQSSDSLGETSDEPDITTEPDGEDYTRQSDTVATAQIDGSGATDFGWETQNLIEFLVEDATAEVDAVAMIVSFTSEITEDTEDTPHLIGFDNLDAGRVDLTDQESVQFEAGNLRQRLSAGSVA